MEMKAYQEFFPDKAKNEHYNEVKSKQQLSVNTPVSIGTGKKIGRNEPCHCGGGKKAKKCCLKSNALLGVS